MKTRLVRMRFGVLLTALALAVGLVVAGCGGGGSTGGGTTGGAASAGSEPEAKAKPGGTLTIADSGEALTLDPTKIIENNSIHVVTQVVEPLFKANMAGKIEPWLAKSMKVSPDHKTWTVTLRKGIDFSDGRPLTAADVVFSLHNVIKSEFWGFMFEGIAAVKETSPTTVVITTKKPNAKLEGPLSLPFAAAIIPKNFGGESEAEFAQKPIGTGPFVVASWKHGEALTLEKNPHYWKPGLPLLEKVVFENMPDVNSRTTQLRAGELSAMFAPDWSQISSLEADPNVHVGIYAMGMLDSLGLNMKEPLFKNPKVREAVSLAVNREGIITAALAGHGEPAGSWLPPVLEDHDASIKAPAQDLEKAKALLAEAVKEEGLDPSITLSTLSGDSYVGTASQVVQADLEEAGFKVGIQQLDESALIAQLQAGKYDAALGGALSSDIVDPSELASFWPATNALNTFGDTETVARLAEEASTATDESVRRQKYFEIQEAVDKEKALVTLDYHPFVWAMQSNVTGFDVNSTGVPWLAEAGFTE
ncbi:MAG: ABC transporter substrate-binding protein [Actinobacteria bacterium]|nr:ABC transporter substrate-binding protein [Actinomycetota bacterium]